MAYYSPHCPIRHLFPPSSVPAKTKVRKEREATIRSQPISEAGKTAHHYLKFARNTSVVNSVAAMREHLARHSKYRAETLLKKSKAARIRSFREWEHAPCGVWQWWPYHIREIVSDRLCPALFAAAIANAELDQSHYLGIVSEILMETNALEKSACELPYIERMLIHWESELAGIMDRLEQVAHSIRLEIGPVDWSLANGEC